MEIDINEKVKVSDGATADKDRQEKEFKTKQAEARTERIGHAAEIFNKYHVAYASEHNLEPDELVAAVFLENLNCREFYPSRLGGPAGYDQICQQVSDWFQKNK